MKIVRFQNLKYKAASHEDKKSPGAWKKVLFEKEDFVKGHIPMVNWAKLPVGKAFKSHYHQDMQEIFVIIKGKAKIKIEKEEAILKKGDAVIIPIAKVHQMENLGKEAVEYLVIGISLGKEGKTITV